MKPDIDAIKSRCVAATPGPWYVYEREVGAVGKIHQVLVGPRMIHDLIRLRGESASGDVNFVARSRTDIPALLAYIEVQEARIVALEAEVARLKDPGRDSGRDPWFDSRGYKNSRDE